MNLPAITLSSLLALLVAVDARTAVLVREYVKVKDTVSFETHLRSVVVGLEVANTVLAVSNQPPIYCPPSGLRLQTDNYRQILDSAIGKLGKDQFTDFPVEHLLILELRRMFPCTQVASPEATTSRNQPNWPDTHLTFEPATVGDPRSSVTMGCVGKLEVTSGQFAWHDTNLCWSGPDVAAPLSDLEWVEYEVWALGTSLRVKLRSWPTHIELGIPGTAPEKFFRHVSAYAPQAKQRCFKGALDGATSSKGSLGKIVTPLSCDKWINGPPR